MVIHQLSGQFLPQEGADPNIGEVGKPEFVEEDKVEVVVADTEGKDEIRKAVEHLKKVRIPMLSLEVFFQLRPIVQVHPYEEVAFEVYRLEDI